MITSFSEAVSYISDIPRFTSKHTPEETGNFLNKIGDPSATIPTVHVAGTNGKGSVCAFLQSTFLEAGIHTMTFTSPHLVDIRERFLFDGEMISEEDFVICFKLVMNKIDEYHPSYFEFLFFMMMEWVKIKNPELIILETGLGGRLDATNSISSPKVCIITEIGLDHMEYLGNTVGEIAGEKAGIIKPGAKIVYMDKPVSGEVIRNRAVLLGCEYRGVSKNTVKNLVGNGKNIDFSIPSVYYGNASLRVDTCALYQAENGALAFYAIEYLAKEGIFDISLETIRKGYSKMKWPGRMEQISRNIYIDGAHNEDGIAAFIETVSMDGAETRHLVYSAVADKNIEAIADKLVNSGLFAHFYVASLYGSRGASEERLEEAFRNAGASVSFFDNVDLAFDAMRNNLGESERGYVSGSLYLVGKIKELLNND